LDPPIVDPIAMFLSAVMLLEHVGEVEKAGRIRDAIAAVVKEGKARTYDMMRIAGGAKAISQGAASTVEMTDAVLAKLEQPAAAVLECVAAGDGI
jgi:3-isopropylmalate dehydrogenase